MELFIEGSALEKMERVLNSFGPRGKVAVVRALNRALAGIKTDTSKEIRKAYPGFKAAEIKKSFDIKRANKTTLVGMARSRGTRQPLIYFGARPNKPEAKRPAVGASVRITSRKRIKGAFVAKMDSGHIGLFIRSGIMGRNGDLAQEQIQELFTFAVPQAVKWIEENQGTISAGVQKRFVKNLDHEMDRVFKELEEKF